MAPSLSEVRTQLTADTAVTHTSVPEAMAVTSTTDFVVSEVLQNELLARLRSYIAAGETDHNICSELDLKPSELKVLRERLYEQETMTLTSRSTADTFIEYRMRMERICDDLDGVHNGATAARQFTAAMGALKAKAQIIDKVIDRGQDMGLVSRAAQKHELVGGVAVAHLTDEQLIGKMREIHNTTTSYIDKYGEQSIGDIAVPDIYEEK